MDIGSIDMWLVVSGLIVLLLGIRIGWVLCAIRVKKSENVINGLETKLKTDADIVTELKREVENKDKMLDTLQISFGSLQQSLQDAKAFDERRFKETGKNLAEQRKLIGEAREKLSDTFKVLSSNALKSNNQVFAELANKALERFASDVRGDMEIRQESIEKLVDSLKAALKGHEEYIGKLQEETKSLAEALKNTHNSSQPESQPEENQPETQPESQPQAETVSQEVTEVDRTES